MKRKRLTQDVSLAAFRLPRVCQRRSGTAALTGRLSPASGLPAPVGHGGARVVAPATRSPRPPARAATRRP
jgi:hypothetical protein